jgi:hypothetical protein
MNTRSCTCVAVTVWPSVKVMVVTPPEGLQRVHVGRGARVEVDDVVSGAAVDRVVAVVRVDMEDVVAVAAQQHIAAGPGPDLIVPGAAVERSADGASIRIDVLHAR